MIDTTLFLIGAVGLAAQALIGLGHGGHGHGHGHHASHQGHHQAHGHANGSRAGGILLALLSPMTLFSLCLGIGASSLMLRHTAIPGGERIALAVLGGLLFYGAFVRPLWGLLFQFASRPSRALEGTLSQEVEAISRFDARGRGMVQMAIDGQVSRILAVLESEDIPDAAAIRPGDRLTVTAVNAKANTCRVTRL